ncbi:HDOD domain-containing protein [Kamptonema cortianum]|nr:HDOD domain-containing protein [Geitlerinema splendidum]MDK3157016.1 HDOD domain-containing protein [Kamptonema cortianum]
MDQLDPIVWEAVRQAIDHRSVGSILVKLPPIVHSENIGQAMLARLISTNRDWETALMNAVSVGLWEFEEPPEDPRSALAQLSPEHAWRATVFAGVQCIVQGLLEDYPELAKEFLCHAWATAIGTTELVTLSDVSPRIAFAAGIFHNIGYPVLAHLYPHEHALLRRRISGTSIPLHEIEQSLFDFNHQVTGALFSQVAMLDDSIITCCSQHHFDGFISDPLVAAVRLSDHIAHQIGCSMGIENIRPELPSHLLTDIGVDDYILPDIVQQITSASASCSKLVISTN